ncbi:MAG: MMPL family transporter [Pseudomonadota bacterium]
MRALLEAMTRLSCRYAVVVVCLGCLLAMAGTWVFTARLSVVTDTDAMIDPSLPYRQAYASFQAAYPQLGDTLAVVIESDVPEMRQRALSSLSTRLQGDEVHFKSIYAPQALAFFQNNGLLFLDYGTLADRMDALIAAQPLLGPLLREPSLSLLLDGLAEAAEEGGQSANAGVIDSAIGDVARVSENVLAGRPDVLSLQGLLDQQDGGYMAILVVQPVLDPSRVQPAKEAIAALRAHIAEVQAQLPVRVDMSLTGKIALNAEELKSVTAGASVAGLLSLVLVTLVLYLGTRSVRAVLAMVFNLVVGLIATGAGALLIFGSLNIISVAFAVLFIGLGIDFAIHLLLRAREMAAHEPLASALEKAAGTSGLALALCAPTTALAFLSFTPTDYAGLSQLGVIAALGVFIALITSLTVLPALLVLLRIQPKPARSAAQSFAHTKPRLILMFAVFTLLPALYLAPHIPFSADPIALKDPSSPSVQAYQRLLAQDGFSPHVMHVMAQTPEQAGELAAQAKMLDGAHRAVWLGSFVPPEQGDKRDLIDETYFLLASDLLSVTIQPHVEEADAASAMDRLAKATGLAVFMQFKESAARRPELWGTLGKSLLNTVPDLRDTLKAQLTTTGVEPKDVPKSIVSRYRGTNGRYRLEILPANPLRTQENLAAFVDGVQKVFPTATGSPVQIVRSGQIVKGAMLQATLTALVLVSVFLLLILRSVLQVVLVLAPVVLAGIATLASAVLLGLSFNFANVIVLPLLLGLGVDAGIHYVRRAFESGDGHTLDTGSTGRAVLLSALTTIGSFGTLMVSSHAGTASMGQLLTLALFWLMTTTLIVLPALLALRVKRRGAAA